MKLEYDPFCLRQFDEKANGTKLKIEDKDKILDLLTKFGTLKDSDNDFCKYLIIPNMDMNIKTSIIPLTLEIQPFIRTDYIARVDGELPILTRIAKLPSWHEIPNCNYLVAILYTTKQLKNEFYSKEENLDKEFYLTDDIEYGIVAIQATVEAQPDPYVPITMMRNALGEKYGGNGVYLDENKYLQSVEFWKRNIIIG